jgi:glycosyltransferase involved in cell wall biosynthesis
MLERKLARYTDIIIAINRQLQKDLTTTYSIAPPSKILFSPLGIDPDFYQRSAKGYARENIRKALSLKADEIAVVAIGRLVPVKQHRLFVQIAARLMQHHPAIPFRFFIIGDGPEREALIEMAESYGLTTGAGHQAESRHVLHFFGWRTDIAALLSGMDILLHTSLNEGTPVSILEAMWMGLPVVSTPVGGISELIEQSRAGFAGKDENELSQYLVDLALKPKLRAEMGKNGRDFMEHAATVQLQANTLRQRIEALNVI